MKCFFFPQEMPLLPAVTTLTPDWDDTRLKPSEKLNQIFKNHHELAKKKKKTDLNGTF